MTLGTKITVLALVCAALIGVSVHYFTRDSDSRSRYEIPDELPGEGVVGVAAESSDPYDILITYTDKGYSPRDITIPKGTRVRFLNISPETTWPASGLHPTHTLYPEKAASDCLGSSFDSCAELGEGDFYNFTFNYEGTWTFHDHLHPYNSGIITVVIATTSQE